MRPAGSWGAWVLTALLASGLSSGCEGETGTFAVSVLASPDSDLLERIDRLRVTLESPREVIEKSRDENGQLRVSLDVEADTRISDIFLEGFDAEGELIAVGRSGPLPLAAIDAQLSVFMAAPMSLSPALAELDPPRGDMGLVDFSFGTFFAGGRNSDGPVGDLDVYSTYRHSISAALDMPARVSSPTVTAGPSGFVYILGGVDAEGADSPEAFTFDSSIPPAGAYRSIVMEEEYARSGKTAAVAGEDLFVVSGDPALVLDGLLSTTVPLTGGEGLDGPAVTALLPEELQIIFVGADVPGGTAGIVRGQVIELETIDSARRREHVGVALSTGEALWVGGSIEGEALETAILYRPETQQFFTLDLLQTARRNPAVVASNDYLVVAGGLDTNGQPVGDVEVFDASSSELTPVAVLPLQIPRSGASAALLSSGQVLIAGGFDEDGEAIGLIEVFNPDE